MSAFDPSYQGSLGTTHQRQMQYICPSGAEVTVEILVQVNAVTDAALAQELIGGAHPPMIQDPGNGALVPVYVRRIFHDPRDSLFVLILTDADRHQELRARAELLLELERTSSLEIIPKYVRDFLVVYSGEELGRLIASRKNVVDEKLRAKELGVARVELERRAGELRKREADCQRLESQIETENIQRKRRHTERLASLSAREEEQARASRELALKVEQFDAEKKAFLQAQARASTRASKESSGQTPQTENISAVEDVLLRDGASASIPHVVSLNNTSDTSNNNAGTNQAQNTADHFDDDDYESFDAIEMEDDSDTDTVVADDLVEEAIDRIMDDGDGSTHPDVGDSGKADIENWIRSRKPSMITLDAAGRVQVALSLPAPALEALLSADLKVMLQLHRLPSYPVVTLSIGTPTGFTSGRPAPVTLFFNVAEATDSAVIEALGRDFTFHIDLFDADYIAVRKRTISADLSSNARYVLSVAHGTLAKLRSTSTLSYSRALTALDEPSYDRFGRLRSERKEFREDVLSKLDQPSTVRWGIHVCRRFSSPEGMDYLLLVRGYPLDLWRQRRRAVILRAYELGLWIGNTLADIAISEQIAPSRRVLVEMMAKNFIRLIADKTGHDLDDDSVRDNWSALTDELTAQGVDAGKFVAPSTKAISSELQDVASGIIGRVTALSLNEEVAAAKAAGPRTLAEKSVDQLVALLGDRDRRFEAALQLCRSLDRAAIDPLFGVLGRMTRAEAGDVFGGIVGFGDRATGRLITTLSSRKGFLRQGAALSLAAIGSDVGLEPVCDLLVSEPTDIWKEIARALGEYGRSAIQPLAARLRGHSEVVGERVSWALAHIAARNHKGAVEALCNGSDSKITQVARHALELMELAGRDNRDIWDPKPGRDHTVRRAFSKRIYEAIPEFRAARPTIMGLSEIEFMDAVDMDDDVQALDESDILPN